MKIVRTTLTALSLSLVLAAPAFACHQSREENHGHWRMDKIESRLHRQQSRIERGIESDRLTHKESEKLKKQFFRIHRLSRKYSKDGRLSRGEYEHLTRKLDKNSQLINEYVHNGIDRYIAYHDKYSGRHYNRIDRN